MKIKECMMLNYFYKIASICIFLSLMTDYVLAKTMYPLRLDPDDWNTNQGPVPVSVFIEIETNQNFSTERGIAFDLIVKNDSSREYPIDNPLDYFMYFMHCIDIKGISGNSGTPRQKLSSIFPMTNLSEFINGVTIKSGHLNGRELSHQDMTPTRATLPARGEYKYSLVIDRLDKGTFQTGEYSILFAQIIRFRDGEFASNLMTPYVSFDSFIKVRLTR